MKNVIPGTIGPESAKLIAAKCTSLVSTPTLEVDKSFFALYLLSVSWNSRWKVKLKIALSELKTFLKEEPTSQEFDSFIMQCTAFRAEHKVSQAYLEKAQVFAGILAADLSKNLSQLNKSHLLQHIEAILQADEAWQSELQEELKAVNLRESLEANTVANLMESASEKVSAATRRKPKLDGASKAAPAEETLEVKDGFSIEVYNVNKVMALLEKQAGGGGLMDQESNKQKKLLIDLVSNPGVKPLAQYQEDGIASLYGRFPHFKPVLDFISTSLAMAGCGEAGTPSLLPPILLRGTPGTGKSYFAEELAKVLNTTFMRKDLGVISEAFVISGLDSSWRGAKPGVVFETLTGGKFANPVICLDEVDKARVSGHNSSPIASLYSLLEPATSAAFKDEFLPIELNASKINWILTANDGDIPEPVLSRLEIFDIPTPTKDECMIIAQSVWESVCKEVLPKGHGFAEQLPEDVRSFMGLLSPRIMRKALSFAVGCAAKDKRKHLQVSDLNLSASRYSPKAKKQIGFVNN